MKAFQFNTLALLLSLSVVSTVPAVHARKPSAPEATTSDPAAAPVFTDPVATPEESAPAKPAKKAKRSKPVQIEEDDAGIGRDEIRANAPRQYTVVKGDTLWGISGRFLKNPWRWPKLWQLNRNEIKNPHLIYPGEVLALEFDANGRARLRRAGKRYTNYLGRLSPRVRVEQLQHDAIPTISPSEISPFLSKPLVINPGELDSAPKIVGSLDDRVVLGQGDVVYVKNMPNNGDDEQVWQIYRPGRALTIERLDKHGDMEKVVLGYEAIHLGDAKVRKQAEDISSVEILRAKQEIMKGDRLVPAPKTIPMNYIPRAPESDVDASIISLPEGVAETGRNNIVAISAGTADNLDVGHVLAIHRRGRVVRVPGEAEDIKLPDERVGLLMIFRAFDNVSYGLVMGSERPIQIGDRLRQP